MQNENPTRCGVVEQLCEENRLKKASEVGSFLLILLHRDRRSNIAHLIWSCKDRFHLVPSDDSSEGHNTLRAVFSPAMVRVAPGLTSCSSCNSYSGLTVSNSSVRGIQLFGWKVPNMDCADVVFSRHLLFSGLKTGQ